MAVGFSSTAPTATPTTWVLRSSTALRPPGQRSLVFASSLRAGERIGGVPLTPSTRELSTSVAEACAVAHVGASRSGPRIVHVNRERPPPVS